MEAYLKRPKEPRKAWDELPTEVKTEIELTPNYPGHGSIKNTMLYIQLEEVLFKEDSDEFTSRVAKTVKEAMLQV